MKTKRIVQISLLAAITLILTIAYKLPIGGTGGYIHFGDSVIYLTAFLLGGVPAAYVGAIGGGLADILSGFGAYALPTLIIKSLMAILAAKIYEKSENKIFGMVLAFVVGGVVMVGGYYIAESIMYLNFSAPIASIPMNLLQVVFSIPLPVILTSALKGKIK